MDEEIGAGRGQVTRSHTAGHRRAGARTRTPSGHVCRPGSCCVICFRDHYPWPLWHPGGWRPPLSCSEAVSHLAHSRQGGTDGGLTVQNGPWSQGSSGSERGWGRGGEGGVSALKCRPLIFPGYCEDNRSGGGCRWEDGLWCSQTPRGCLSVPGGHRSAGGPGSGGVGRAWTVVSVGRKGEPGKREV